MLQKVKHYPRLDTILMVEKVLKEMDESAIKVAELKRRLPKQVNHNTLKLILEYLEQSFKIIVGINGITWAVNDSFKLAEAIRRGKQIYP